MLEPSVFPHQVAGHVEESLLSIGQGRFVLKPMVKSDLFARERTFYESINSEEEHSTNSPVAFMCRYHGILYRNSRPTPRNGGVGGLIPHIVLDDQTHGYILPNCIDIKMGRFTYEPTALQSKKDKEVLKYPHQSTIGFRISGFKIYNKARQSYLSCGKPFGRSILPSEVKYSLALLFFDGFKVNEDIIRQLIIDLERLLLWMRSQVCYHFYCSSLLVVFDAMYQLDDEVPLILPDKTPANPVPLLALGNPTSIMQTSGALPDSVFTANSDQQTLVNIELAVRRAYQPPPIVRVKMIDFAHIIPINDRLLAAGSDGNGDSQQGMVVATEDENYIWGLQSLVNHLRSILQDVAHSQQGTQEELYCNIHKMIDRVNALEGGSAVTTP